MSHFIFGVVGGVRAASKATLGRNIEARWGTDAQQGLILEMLAAAGKPAIAETPFCLVPVGDDNADALVSPYRCEPSQIIANVDCALTWLENERAGNSAELWVTEGYGDAFSLFEGTYEQLRNTIRNIVQTSLEVPSLRLRMASGG